MISWQSEISLPEKSHDFEYGYILNKEEDPVECDKDTLLEMLESDSNVKLVATPDHDSFIIPGSDFFTLQPLLKKRLHSIKDSIRWALISIAVFGGLMLFYAFVLDENYLLDKTGRLYLLVFGVIPLLNGLYDYFAIKRVNEKNYKNEAIEVMFAYWISQKRTISVYIATGIIILITLSQYISGFDASIHIAGLVKPDTFKGEYWRILTGPLLHGGLLHIFFNSIAMFIIGRMVIRVSDIYQFSIVMLISIILGSLFSMYFMPEQTSVGLSGGIMGLIGFLLIIALKQRKQVPHNILKSITITIILIVILGLGAPDIIDNAAHGGGLLGGILVGMASIRSKRQQIPYRSAIPLKIIGFVSIAVLMYSVVFLFGLLY